MSHYGCHPSVTELIFNVYEEKTFDESNSWTNVELYLQRLWRLLLSE